MNFLRNVKAGQEPGRVCGSPFLIVLLAGLLSFALSCAHAPKNTLEQITPAEHLELAGIYESKGEIDFALERYRIAIASDKKSPRAYFAYANLNLKLGRFAPARDAYLKAIKLEPESGIYRNNLGWLYMEQGRYKKAIAEVERALQVDPARGYIFLDTLGVILMRQGRYVTALENLEAAATSAPASNTAALLKIYGHMVDLHSASGDSGAHREAQQWIDALK
jgi:tetratricopeptide (TPR) repeat protein